MITHHVIHQLHFTSHTFFRFAFHDALRLYLATEFYPGGDLLGLLGKYEVFPEVCVKTREVLNAVRMLTAL